MIQEKHTTMGIAHSRAAAPPAAASASASVPERTAPPLFLVAVAAAVVITTLTGSMVNVLLPLMRADFGASPAAAGWVITSYALAYAVGVPLYGRLSDAFGVRRVFAAGLLGFAAGGLACSLAPSLPLLVAGRALQGIGGAAVPALASVAVARALPAGQRGGALGVVASSVGVGSTIGPVVGGLIGGVLGWRFLFVASLVLMLLLLPVAWRVLPDGAVAGARRFDLLGGVLLGLAAGSFLFGVTQFSGEGNGVFALAGLVVAALAAVGFVWRIRTAPDPFAPPALFGNRAYVAVLVVGFFAMMAQLAALVLAPLLVIEANGLTPAAAGLVIAPSAAAIAVLAPIAGRLSDRFGARTVLLAGLGIVTAALVALSTAAGAPAPVVALGMLGVGAGFALVQPAANNAAAASLPAADLGVGMGLFAGAFFLGGGSGAALSGAILAAREGVAGAINPLHAASAVAYSDAFLAAAAAALVAAIAARRVLAPGRETSGPATAAD